MRFCIFAFILASASVHPIWAQADIAAQRLEERLTVLSAYRNACLEPGNARLVLAFDSVSTDFMNHHPKLAIGQGMRATAKLMMAESMWNPLDKLVQFQKWKPKLEEALDRQPDDPDLRFFRLSIQFSVPSILEYNDDMEIDAQATREALAAGHWSSSSEHHAFVSSFLDEL